METSYFNSYSRLSGAKVLYEYRPHNYPLSSQETYRCPKCGTFLSLLPGNRRYCPQHGVISKWKYRFPRRQYPVQLAYQPTNQEVYALAPRVQAYRQPTYLQYRQPRSQYAEPAPQHVAREPQETTQEVTRAIPAPSSSYCPYCRQPLAYAPNLQRWYCRYCQRPI